MNLETKISTAVLPVKEKLIARLHEANFHDRSVVPQQSIKTDTSMLDSVSQSPVDNHLSCSSAVSATQTFYNGNSNLNVLPSFCAASTSTETASVLTKKLCGSRIGGANSDSDENVSPTSSDLLVIPTVVPASTSSHSLSKPVRTRKDKAVKSSTTTKASLSRSKNSGNGSPSTVTMTSRLSGQISYDMMSEGYTTSSSFSTSRGKDNVSESGGSSDGTTDMDAAYEYTETTVQRSGGLVHVASTESFHLGFTTTAVADECTGNHNTVAVQSVDLSKDGLLSQPFIAEPAHDDFFFSEFSGQPDFQASQVNFDDYCDPAVGGVNRSQATGASNKPTGPRQARIEKRKVDMKECTSAQIPVVSGMLVEPLAGYPEDCEFRMSSKRRRRLSQIVPYPRKPRAADYSCSVCTEPYQKVAEENPWWAVYQHECPKCSSVQIPRLDIGLQSNAIELDPNVIALYGEGIDDGEVEGFEGYALYEEDEESCDEDEEVEEEFIDDVEIKRDAFPFDSEGCLTREQATRLLVLMSHARTCSGEHESEELSEVCCSAKFLMLHVRDCPGVDICGNVCRYSWCQPTKKMLRHLTRCFEPATCGVCCAASVSDSFAHLCKLNNNRASAVPIINEKLTYASRLESRDELALKLEAKRRQDAMALMGVEPSSSSSSVVAGY